MNMICPQCRAAFPDEDFCPHHGVRLVAIPIEHQSDVLPAHATAKPKEDSTARVDDKRAAFMKKHGIRLADEVPEPTFVASPGSDDPASPLPEELRKQGWQVAGTLSSNAAVNRWPVEQMVKGERRDEGEFHRFHNGALTPVEIYKRLHAAPAQQMVKVLGHGTLDLIGSRADYELVSRAQPDFIALNQWLAEGTPSESRALDLLRPLVTMFGRLAEGGVRPLLLEPETLVRNPKGDVWLASAALLQACDAPPGFHPDFARSSLLPRDWSAPELTEEFMSSHNAGAFSLGQLLAACLWGRPCGVAELRTGAVHFRSIADARLARIMMGCLWPRSTERWGLTDVSSALDARDINDLPAPPPWRSLVPGATSEGFGLAGATYWRLEDLLDVAVQPANWLEATSRLGDILEWAAGTAWQGQACLLRDALAQGRNVDWVLVKLRRTVAPGSPPTWRELDLSDVQAEASLVALAQRVLHEGGDAETTTMRDLFDIDLRGAFLPGSRTH